jgi:hypothetical protein
MDDNSVVEATPKPLDITPSDDLLDKIMRALHLENNDADGEITDHNRDVHALLTPLGENDEEKIDMLARLLAQAIDFYNEGEDKELTDKEWLVRPDADKYLWVARYVFKKIGQ